MDSATYMDIGVTELQFILWRMFVESAVYDNLTGWNKFVLRTLH